MLDSIKKYYLEELVNPNNRGLPHTDNVIERIECLRELLLDVFRWREAGNIVFLPNPHYAKVILINYFLNHSKIKDLKIYSNSMFSNHDLIEGILRVNVKYITKSTEIEDETDNVLYLASLYEESHQEELNDIVRDRDKKYVPKLGRSYSRWEWESGRYLVVETFTDDYKFVDRAYAFIFNVVPGVTILGFRDSMKIQPVILGSGSVEYANEIDYKIKEDFRILECGTLNVPLLLALETHYRNKIRRKS